MTLVQKKVEDLFHVLDKMSDPRLSDNIILSTPIPVIAISALYYYFIYYGGPKFMEKRRPFNMKKIIIAYNIGQVMCNGFIFIKACTYLPYFLHSCIPMDFSDTPFTNTLLQYSKYFFYLKIIDYLDTVFFVLNKKFSHVTFLHVYHHMLMAIFGWIGLKICAGSHMFYLGFFNTFVHAVMYSYYTLAAIDSTKKFIIPYKKYVTQLQLTQFALLSIIFAIAIRQPPSCTNPRFMVYMCFLQDIVMMGLFINFYYHAYIKPKKHQKQT